MVEQKETLAVMERILEHVFQRPELLKEALMHRSAVSQSRVARGRSSRLRGDRRSHRAAGIKGKGSNERLEFLGDRVLGLLMAEWLYEYYPDEQEGALGARHAHLVSRPVLAEIAEQMALPTFLSIAIHEETSGIRQLDSVKADAMEALLGALFLDGGLAPARHVVRKLWGKRIKGTARPPKEPKTLLQEYLLGRGEPLPHYETLSSDGPSHAPVFCVEVRALGKAGHGQAGNKRHAESEAAVDLLQQLGQESQYV